MNVVEARSLGRRYGRRWALKHLDLDVPEHAVVGLVGPNGAGKSTLLHLVAGLIDPTEGNVSVLGGTPGSAAVLPDVAFVAQDSPLPKRARVREIASIAAGMNVRWNQAVVDDRLAELRIDESHRAGELSGGQRAQFALALALAKRPKLLLLDEPVASLDPLARRGFLQSLMAAVADGGVTVVFSTHLIDDLQRTCDHLVVLGQGTLLLSGSIDEIVQGHAVLVGPPDRPLPRGCTIVGGHRSVGHQHLVAASAPVIDPAWQVQTPTLDEIVLAHLALDPEQHPVRHLEVV
ncbi:MAG TPA: ABC transporter ATP-binding protein [Ilumatobacteraceae bacterium]|nr:ABC transporter ATP-binding protein [Ilumatobacteraceae bacterium]